MSTSNAEGSVGEELVGLVMGQEFSNVGCERGSTGLEGGGPDVVGFGLVELVSAGSKEGDLEGVGD